LPESTVSDPAFAPTPPTPYYAVIFASRRVPEAAQYAPLAEKMAALAAKQPGYLGIESARGADGFGITVSYWTSPEAIRAWKENAEHLMAQQMGVAQFYERYEVRVARVERAYSGPTGQLHAAAWEGGTS
jgi:heme-degrading monooxygenase HmoA